MKQCFQILLFCITNILIAQDVTIPPYKGLSSSSNFIKNQFLDLQRSQTYYLDFNICDNDTDGYVTFQIEDIENYVIQNVDIEDNYYIEQVLISTSEGNIITVNSPSSSPSISTNCTNVPPYSLTDIAIDSNQNIIVCGGVIMGIDADCNTFYYSTSFPDSNSLSFDDLDNMYIGFNTNSQVLRLTIEPDDTLSSSLWHDFGVGEAGGDFVLVEDKMYVAWKLGSDIYRLYEVTVNANRDYISHIDLGPIPNKTFGLASELGQLYGVTTDKLYHIDLDTFTFTDIIYNTNPADEWFGAAGLHEAVEFELSTHINLSDAQNNNNPLSGTWTNTQNGGGTLYIRIENTLTGTYDIVELQIVISTAPEVHPPNNLEACYIDSFNVFDLNTISTQMQINPNDILDFQFYLSNPEVNTNAVPIPLLYQSTLETETLYVRVEKDQNGCPITFPFELINRPGPSLLPFSDSDAPTLLESCYFDLQNNGYFLLPEIASEIILDSGELDITYFETLEDAQNHINPINHDLPYYPTDSSEVLFIKAINSNDCTSISSFHLNMDCIENSTELTTIIFPKFITPNYDGINDYWNVYGISENLRETSSIRIFDRYGKLLSVFTPANTIGWDGLYKNQKLPATDYWFLFETKDGRQIRGHFSVIR